MNMSTQYYLSIEEQLAQEELRLANMELGEPGWYYTVTCPKTGRPMKVWVTDLDPRV